MLLQTEWTDRDGYTVHLASLCEIKRKNLQLPYNLYQHCSSFLVSVSAYALPGTDICYFQALFIACR